MEPGSHSGLSLDGDVGESTGGSLPGTVVSGFAVESAPSAAIDVSPTSLSASSIPAPANPISAPPSETQLFRRVTPSSPSWRFMRLAAVRDDQDVVIGQVRDAREVRERDGRERDAQVVRQKLPYGAVALLVDALARGHDDPGRVQAHHVVRAHAGGDGVRIGALHSDDGDARPARELRDPIVQRRGVALGPEIGRASWREGVETG